MKLQEQGQHVAIRKRNAGTWRVTITVDEAMATITVTEDPLPALHRTTDALVVEPRHLLSSAPVAALGDTDLGQQERLMYTVEEAAKAIGIGKTMLYRLEVVS